MHNTVQDKKCHIYQMSWGPCKMVNAIFHGIAKFPRVLDVRSKPKFADTKFAVTKNKCFHQKWAMLACKLCKYIYQ